MTTSTSQCSASHSGNGEMGRDARGAALSHSRLATRIGAWWRPVSPEPDDPLHQLRYLLTTIFEPQFQYSIRAVRSREYTRKQVERVYCISCPLEELSLHCIVKQRIRSWELRLTPRNPVKMVRAIRATGRSISPAPLLRLVTFLTATSDPRCGSRRDITGGTLSRAPALSLGSNDGPMLPTM